MNERERYDAENYCLMISMFLSREVFLPRDRSDIFDCSIDFMSDRS